MGAKKIADNNMSQDALLRSVKSSLVSPSLDSSLKPNEKALAESILNTLLEKSEGSDDYILRLTSKNIDALMGRLETYFSKAKDDFTSNELETVKTALLDAINAIKSTTPLKELSEDSTSALAAVNAAIQQLEAIILKKLDELVEQLKALFDNNATLLNAVAPEDSNKEEKEDEGKDLSEFEAPSDNDEFNEADLNLIQDFIGQQFSLLTKLVTDVSALITTNIEAVNAAVVSLQDNMQSSINSLQPTPKEKKLSKQAKKTQDKINKIITDMEAALKKVEDFVNNFVNVLIANFATFMNGVFKVLFTFFLKLMLGIVIPFLLAIGLALYLLKDPLMEILQPIMDFILNVLTLILDFLRPIRDLIIRIVEELFDKIVIPLLLNVIKPILENVVKPILENVVKPLIEAVGAILIEFFKAIKPWIRPLVNTVLKILQTFLEAILPWIKPLVDVVLATLVVIMETIKVVVEILKEFLSGFKNQAAEIGDAVGRVVLAIVECVEIVVNFFKEVGQLLVDIAKIIHAPIKFIADFFEGFNTNAKKIGEKVSEIALVMADIVLKILKAVDKNFGNLTAYIKLYVVAPLAGLRRWLNSKIISFKNALWVPAFAWGTPNSNNWTGIGDVIDMLTGMKFYKYYPFTGEKVDFGDAPKNSIPNPDEGKSVSELVSDEMSKMQKKIEEDAKAEKAAQLAAQLQQKKIEDMLNNTKIIEDMSEQVKDIHEKVINGLDTNNKIDFTSIIDEIQTIQLTIVSSFEQIKTLFNDIVQKLNSDIENLKEQFSTLLTTLEDKITTSTVELKQLSINVATIIITTIVSAIATFKDDIQLMFTAFKAEIFLEISILKDDIQLMFTAFKAEIIEFVTTELYNFKVEILQNIEILLDLFKNEILSMFDTLEIAIILAIDIATITLTDVATKFFDLTIEEITIAVSTVTDLITELGESIKAFIEKEITTALTTTINFITEKTNSIKADLAQISTVMVLKFELLESKLLDGFTDIANLFDKKFEEAKEHFDTTIDNIKSIASIYYASLFTLTFSIIKMLNDVLNYELRIIRLLILSDLWWFNNSNEDFPAKALERFIKLKDLTVDINDKIDDIIDFLNNVSEEIVDQVISCMTVIDELLEEIKNNLDDSISSLPDNLVEKNDNMLQVSALTSMPEILSVDNVEQAGKANTANLMSETTLNPAEELKEDNKKAAKAQNKFLNGLMAFLELKFGEVLERLDNKEDPQVLPIPMTFNANNPASLENI